MKKKKKMSSTCHTPLRRCEQEQERLATEISKLSKTGFLLQGSITTRWMRCGKASCLCQRDPQARHGPYHQWTVKRRGKTVTVYLDEQQAKICRKWIENNKRTEELMSQMQALTLRLARLRGIPLK